MNTTHHTCPIPGCQSMVPNSMLLCKPHWVMVPKPIQDLVYHHYRKNRGGPSHLSAMKKAIGAVTDRLESQVQQVQRRMPYAD